MDLNNPNTAALITLLRYVLTVGGTYIGVTETDMTSFVGAGVALITAAYGVYKSRAKQKQIIGANSSSIS